MDWISDTMAEAEAATATAAAVPAGSAKQGSNAMMSNTLSFINYNTAFEYCEDLGFFVAVDGACRLSRLLPTAALVSYSPPGSLYQVRLSAFVCTRPYSLSLIHLLSHA
jgi:hypothetical protein